MTRLHLALFIVPFLAASSAAADEPRPVPGVAWWARPSDTGHYVGYSVGGGSLWRGDAPAPDQGTWGWDYGGLLHPHIKLLWGRNSWRRDVPAYRTVGTNVKGHSPSSP